MSGMIDRTTSILSQALDGLTAQQSVISANLANIDTPGYTPQAVDFEAALKREVDAWSAGPGNALAPSAGPSADVAMKTSDPRHYSALGTVGNGSSADVSAVNENTRNDGNRVDLETEMTALTQTQIKYSANSRLITGKFAQLSTVLGGR
jgi:flagellar basal-body rod protein FlgB